MLFVREYGKHCRGYLSNSVLSQSRAIRLRGATVSRTQKMLDRLVAMRLRVGKTQTMYDGQLMPVTFENKCPPPPCAPACAPAEHARDRFCYELACGSIACPLLGRHHCVTAPEIA